MVSQHQLNLVVSGLMDLYLSLKNKSPPPVCFCLVLFLFGGGCLLSFVFETQFPCVTLAVLELTL